MKTMNYMRNIIIIALMICSMQAFAQKKRPSITVLNIDAKGIQLEADQMGNLVRIELEKLDTFDVTDRYDVIYLVEKNKLNIANCYGKMCLLEVGNTISSDYMFTGSVELYGETIITTFRLIDVKGGSIIRTTVQEFLNLPLETQAMVRIGIAKMFGGQIDEDVMSRLTKKFDYENSINNPDKNRVSLTGPRFGYTFIFGEQSKRFQESKSNGGYEAYPAMFQFGYQFEKQYLNEGNYQALFEFIPMITGVDQQMVIPSITLLNGFRDTKRGWEIAIGPAISVASYKDLTEVNGKYYTSDQIESTGHEFKKTLDSRGELQFTSALVLALGKTFKSGKMNIPVNFYATIPTHDGFRIGISVGYNSKK